MNRRDQIENIKRKVPASNKKNAAAQKNGAAGAAITGPAVVDEAQVSNLQAQINTLRQVNYDLSNRMSEFQADYSAAMQTIKGLKQDSLSKDQVIMEMLQMMHSHDYSRVPDLIAMYNSRQQQEQGKQHHQQQQRNLSADMQYSVLLVVDSESVGDICSRFLSEYGCHVDVSTDGLDAVARAQATLYDLILMDEIIPSLDGISATQVIRGYKVVCPIIIMSEHEVQDFQTYSERGVSTVLSKPFTKSMLFKVLDSNLPMHQHQHHQQDVSHVEPTAKRSRN